MHARCSRCQAEVAIDLATPPHKIRCGECGSTFVHPAETVSVGSNGAEYDITYVPADRQRTPDGLPALGSNYEVIEEIARGGMGVVYKARQRSLNRVVALKMIRSGELADEDQVARFRVEAEAAARLDHPGIVPVYEVGEHDGHHFYSMAFVDGVSLHEKVRNDGPLPPRRAAEMLKTVAEAVQFGHDKGVIHRDIKPQNILLDQSESPRVTDFGLARHGESEMTVAGQILGTPSYMPPEQAEGKQHEVGPGSDVYSLGATLYYVLTGRPPFQAAARTETLRQVVQMEPAPLRILNPAVDRDMETICLKCLEKDRAARFSRASELADELNRFLNGEPIRSRPIGPLTRSWRWLKRKRLAAALCVLVIVLFGAIYAAVQYAGRAETLRELAVANDRFETRVDQPELSTSYVDEMVALISDIERMSPGQAAGARLQFQREFRTYVKGRCSAPQLTEDDVRQLEEVFDHLERNNVMQLAELRTLLDQRTNAWTTIVHLIAPFAELDTVFPGDVTRVEGDTLLLSQDSTGHSETTHRVGTLIPCETHARLDVRFDAGWERSSEIGVMLNVDGLAGYEFVLRTVAAGANQEGEPSLPVTFDELRGTGRSAFAEIRSSNASLVQQEMSMSSLPPGPLRFRVERRRGRLSLQIGVEVPIAIDDPFPLSGRQPGVFGLYWPEEVGITDLRLLRFLRPPELSPLEQADELFDTGQFHEALMLYEQKSLEATEAEIRQECRYKQALCLLAMGRPDEAEAIFTDVSLQVGRRWPAVAGCQLWVLLNRRGETRQAQQLMASLRSRYRLGDLSALLPKELREEILGEGR